MAPTFKVERPGSLVWMLNTPLKQEFSAVSAETLWLKGQHMWEIKWTLSSPVSWALLKLLTQILDCTLSIKTTEQKPQILQGIYCPIISKCCWKRTSETYLNFSWIPASCFCRGPQKLQRPRHEQASSSTPFWQLKCIQMLLSPNPSLHQMYISAHYSI